MNRTKKFIINSAASVLQQMVTVIVGLITPRLMMVYYGSEINGLITSLTQFFSYFSLVEAGLASAAVFALYKPLANRDFLAINRVVVAVKRFYMKSGLIFVALTVSLAFLYPFFVFTNTLKSGGIAALVFILGISGIIDFFTLSKYRALLTADQRVYVISLATCVHLILNTVIVMILAMQRVPVLILKGVSLLSVLVRSCILLVYCKHNYKYLDFTVSPDYKSLNKRWDAFYLQILGAIHTGAPVLILSVFLNDLKMTSLYAVYNIVIAGIGSILGVFTSGLSASFGDVIARGERSTLQQAYSEFEYIYYILISIVYAVAFILIQPFVNLYTAGIHDMSYNEPIIGALFVLNGLLYNMKTPQGMLVISAGHYAETKKQTIIQGGIAVVGGVLLARPFGIYGVLLASILSNLYRDVDLMFYVPQNIVGNEWKYTALRMFRIILCIIVIVLLSMPLASYLSSINNYFEWILVAAVLTLVSTLFVMFVNRMMEKEMYAAVWVRVKTILKRRNR